MTPITERAWQKINHLPGVWTCHAKMIPGTAESEAGASVYASVYASDGIRAGIRQTFYVQADSVDEMLDLFGDIIQRSAVVS